MRRASGNSANLAATGYYQGQVVRLLALTEVLHGAENSGKNGTHPRRPTGTYEIEEPTLAELFALLIRGFDDPVGVNHEGVSRKDPQFSNGTFPVFEQA
jgi:hypothetical protein